MTDTNINPDNQNAQPTQPFTPYIDMPAYGICDAPKGFDPYTMPYMAKPEPKPKPIFTAVERAFSFIVFPIAFLLFRYAVCSPTGFVTTGAFAAMITCAIIFMKRSGTKFNGHTRMIAFLLYIFSAVYSVTDNEFIKFLNTVFMILLGIYFVYALGGKYTKVPRFLPLAVIQAAFEYPFENFTAEPQAMAQSADKSGFGKNLKIVLGALAVTAPLSLVVAQLLMQADGGVEKMLGGARDLLLSGDMITFLFQLALSIPIAFYIFGLLYSNAYRSADRDVNEEKWKQSLKRSGMVNNIAVYAAVTPICLLYTLFFISQTNYLMSAFFRTLPAQFGYAEYARRGFFELLAIAVINMVVIILMNLLAKSGGDKKPAALKVYSVLICFYTLVIIASALSKMVMYVSVYGLTRLRLYTGWFMILCAFMFIIIIAKQFSARINIARSASTVFVIMFALLTFGRPDHVIAKYNTEMSRQGKLEYYSSSYLLSLSDDALAVYLEEGCDDGERSETALGSRERYYSEEPLGAFNISSMMVKSKLDGRGNR